MAEGARKYAHARAIKIKLTGSFELDIERVRAVREARPDVWLGVDANQGFDRQALPRAGRRPWSRLNVSLIEQPLPRGSEADLEGFESSIPIAADESVAWPGRRARPGRPLPGRQHQARQVRRPDRGAADGGGSAPPRPRRDGRQHGRHQPRHGARRSSSGSCATSSISTVRPSSKRTGCPASSIEDGDDLVPGRGVGHVGRGGDRRMSREANLVRSAARPDHPVPHQHVGAILLLRNAGAAGLLHDDDAAVRSGEVVEHLRLLHRLRLFHADHRRHHRRPLAGQAPCRDHRRERSWPPAIS